jgi:hypothetical protein
MKKYQYQINERVLAFDNNDWIIPGIITHKDLDMYRVQYDDGGYDWLICDEIRPLEYHVGDYVQSPIGIGKVIGVNDFFMGTITVSYGKGCTKSYYENELKPAQKPSLFARLFGKDVFINNYQ